MQNAWIWIVVIVIVLVGGFMWWQSMQPAATTVNLTPENNTTITTPPQTTPPTTGTTTSTSSGVGDTGTTAAPMTAAITYSSAGFSPAAVTVKKGGTVTWTQQGGNTMWVATGPHPAHTGYGGTSRQNHCAESFTGAEPFDQCTPGASYSFTFDKVGTWPYHDHMDATKFGRVVVVE